MLPPFRHHYETSGLGVFGFESSEHLHITGRNGIPIFDLDRKISTRSRMDDEIYFFVTVSIKVNLQGTSPLSTREIDEIFRVAPKHIVIFLDGLLRNAQDSIPKAEIAKIEFDIPLSDAQASRSEF
jgi:hypothetical protein